MSSSVSATSPTSPSSTLSESRPELDHYWGPVSDAPSRAPPTATALPNYPPFTQLAPYLGRAVHGIVGRHISEAKEKASADSKEAKQMVTEYGREDLIVECGEACAALGRPFILHRIAIPDIPTLLNEISPSELRNTLVLNLCDGTETDGYPGISVVKRLQRLGVAFTSADSVFYDISTSKIAMKRLFDKHNVSTALWTEIPECKTAEEENRVRATLDRIGYPLLIKPDVSYNSCGITPKSKVFSSDEAIEAAKKVRAEFGTVYAEQFLKGREFTVLVTGDAESGVRTYEASERAFDPKIPLPGRFLHLDLLWGTDQKPTEEDKWWYAHAPVELQAKLQDIAKRAYIAVNGNGYARIDIRMDMDSRRICVLEVNAQPGITGWPNTAMGGIIEWSKLSGLPQLFDTLFAFALQRQQRSQRKKRLGQVVAVTGTVAAVALAAYGIIKFMRTQRK